MAERRMFAKTIIDSDAFLTMPLSSQALYFHLGMRGDDEGFVNKPKTVMRSIGAAEDDLKILITKNFIIPFESGIVVVKHWKIHNYIRGDRIKDTVYQDEKIMLTEKENGSYTLLQCQSNVGQLSVECQHRLGKVRLDQDSIEKVKKEKNQIPPSLDLVEKYCIERKNGVDPESFISFYSSKDWMIGKNKMKDWQSAIITWEKRQGKNKVQPSETQPDPSRLRYEELRKEWEQ